MEEPRSILWLLALLLPAVSSTLVRIGGHRVRLAEGVADALAAGIAVVIAVVSLALASRARPSATIVIVLGVASAAAMVWIFAAGISSTSMVPLQNSSLVVFAFAVGGSIGRRVEHPGHVLPSACVAAAADVVSVIQPEGLSHAIASSERALGAFALAAPVPGSDAVTFVLGVGDLLFGALLLGAAARHGAPVWRVTMAILVGAGAALAVAALTGRPIPALVTIGASAVLFEPSFRNLRPRDRTVAYLAMTASAAAAIAVGISAAMH